MHIDENKGAIFEIVRCLPEEIINAVDLYCKRSSFQDLFEIRLRTCGYQTLETAHTSYIVSSDGSYEKDPSHPLFLSEKKMEETVFRICRGSVYAHYDELKKGYISRDGIRIGVCGDGVIKDGTPCGFSKYTSLNIRIPHHVKNSADKLLEYIKNKGCDNVGGILVVSPPGCGKTTFLRSLSSALSSGFYDKNNYCKKKVAIVDERGEIYQKDAFFKGNADFISHIPKAYSIELLTRVMSPDYIVCDEIGSEKEAEAICECATRGVLFIASCHGRNLYDIYAKKSMKKMIDDGIFSTICELYISEGKHMCSIKRAVLGEKQCL